MPPKQEVGYAKTGARTSVFSRFGQSSGLASVRSVEQARSGPSPARLSRESWVASREWQNEDPATAARDAVCTFECGRKRRPMEGFEGRQFLRKWAWPQFSTCACEAPLGPRGFRLAFGAERKLRAPRLCVRACGAPRARHEWRRHPVRDVTRHNNLAKTARLRRRSARVPRLPWWTRAARRCGVPPRLRRVARRRAGPARPSRRIRSGL